MTRPAMKPCGTRAAYMRGCHCPDCTAASRAYHHNLRIDSEPEPLLPTGPPLPGNWIERAACRGANRDKFFPNKGANIGHLRAICAACPVRTECLALALSISQRHDHGFWGGTTPRERRDLRRAVTAGSAP